MNFASFRWCIGTLLVSRRSCSDWLLSHHHARLHRARLHHTRLTHSRLHWHTWLHVLLALHWLHAWLHTRVHAWLHTRVHTWLHARLHHWLLIAHWLTHWLLVSWLHIRLLVTHRLLVSRLHHRLLIHWLCIARLHHRLTIWLLHHWLLAICWLLHGLAILGLHRMLTISSTLICSSVSCCIWIGERLSTLFECFDFSLLLSYLCLSCALL